MNGIELFPAMDSSSSALKAERTRMEVASTNLANAHTTRGADGKPYQRQIVLFRTMLGENLRGEDVPTGVEVAGVKADDRPPVREYKPFHPDADKDGMVTLPDISPLEEMMDMITATRAYEANLSALRQSRDMARETINMGRAS